MNRSSLTTIDGRPQRLDLGQRASKSMRSDTLVSQRDVFVEQIQAKLSFSLVMIPFMEGCASSMVIKGLRLCQCQLYL